MQISKRRSYVICVSASLSICMSTCTEADRYSRGGSQGLPWARARRWRCYRRRMRPATSSRWYSGSRSGLSSKNMTQTKIRYSSVLLSFHTSTSTSRRPDPMPGNFYKPGRLSRQGLVQPRARLVRTNDGRGTFTVKILRCGEPMVGGRRGGGANVYGGARYDYRVGSAALYRWRPVGYGRRR